MQRTKSKLFIYYIILKSLNTTASQQCRKSQKIFLPTESPSFNYIIA